MICVKGLDICTLASFTNFTCYNWPYLSQKHQVKRCYFQLCRRVEKKRVLSELVQYKALTGAGRRNRYLFSAYVDRQHAIMIMVCLKSLNTENSSGNILETNCTYFKICRCWKHTMWFDDWSRYKRVRGILKRKNEYPRKISSYHFPVIFKTTQPVSGCRVTETGRLNTWGPNMGGNFICWTQYFMYI